MLGFAALIGLSFLHSSLFHHSQSRLTSTSRLPVSLTSVYLPPPPPYYVAYVCLHPPQSYVPYVCLHPAAPPPQSYVSYVCLNPHPAPLSLMSLMSVHTYTPAHSVLCLLCLSSRSSLRPSRSYSLMSVYTPLRHTPQSYVSYVCLAAPHPPLFSLMSVYTSIPRLLSLVSLMSVYTHPHAHSVLCL